MHSFYYVITQFYLTQPPILVVNLLCRVKDSNSRRLSKPTRSNVMFSSSMSLEDRLRLKLKVKTDMYGYNAGPPMAIPIYTVLVYCAWDGVHGVDIKG